MVAPKSFSENPLRGLADVAAAALPRLPRETKGHRYAHARKGISRQLAERNTKRAEACVKTARAEAEAMIADPDAAAAAATAANDATFAAENRLLSVDGEVLMERWKKGAVGRKQDALDYVKKRREHRRRRRTLSLSGSERQSPVRPDARGVGPLVLPRGVGSRPWSYRR